MMIRIEITNSYGKYTSYVGHNFYVYNYLDNYGNYILQEDAGQPFMFVHSSHAKVIITSPHPLP